MTRRDYHFLIDLLNTIVFFSTDIINIFKINIMIDWKMMGDNFFEKIKIIVQSLTRAAECFSVH